MDDENDAYILVPAMDVTHMAVSKLLDLQNAEKEAHDRNIAKLAETNTRFSWRRFRRVPDPLTFSEAKLRYQDVPDGLDALTTDCGLLRFHYENDRRRALSLKKLGENARGRNVYLSQDAYNFLWG